MSDYKELFRGDMEVLFLHVVGLCLGNYIEIQVLKDYLKEEGIVLDEERMTEIRRGIRLGGAGLREHGYGELASFLRATQERIEEINEVSDGHE